jgi:hypothetical protein
MLGVIEGRLKDVAPGASRPTYICCLAFPSAPDLSSGLMGAVTAWSGDWVVPFQETLARIIEKD